MLSKIMRKFVKNEPVQDAADECCSIAESIMEEISLLDVTDRRMEGLSCEARRKGSLKRKILRQIKLAKQSAMG
jgi:hypothetical protein